MSIEGHMDRTASIRQPGTPTRSETGELTATWGDAISVKCALHPGMPAWAQEAFGEQVRVDAVGYFPAGTDIRPDHAESGGRGSKVTVDSVAYRCVGVRDPAGKGKFLVAALRRMA